MLSPCFDNYVVDNHWSLTGLRLSTLFSEGPCRGKSRGRSQGAFAPPLQDTFMDEKLIASGDFALLNPHMKSAVEGVLVALKGVSHLVKHIKFIVRTGGGSSQEQSLKVSQTFRSF